MRRTVARLQVIVGLGPAPIRHLAAPAHRFLACSTRRVQVIVLLLLVTQPVRAQTDRQTPLDALMAHTSRVCGESPETVHFQQALRVELQSTLFPSADAASTAFSLTISECDITAGVLVIRCAERKLRMDVSDIPRAARARTLAVALAETLRLPPTQTQPSEPSLPARESRVQSARPMVTTEPRAPHGSTLATPSPSNLDTGTHRAAARSGVELPVVVRAFVLGPEATLALGASIGASVALTEALRGQATLGYVTSHHRSALGEARLHAAVVEGAFDLTVLRPSVHSTFALGTSLSFYRAFVRVDSAWGFDEPQLTKWFALVDLHAELATMLSDDLQLFTRLGLVKDLVGLELRAGGERAMTFHGFGADLRMGAAHSF